MSPPDDAHLTAILVSVPADFAFARLSDPVFVGGWALGSMGLRPVAPGVWTGRSLFDGSEAHVEIHPHPSLGLIDFAVGTATHRSPRISLRVTPGEVLGQGAGVCLVALTALRAATCDADRWARTCTVHETEILLIRAQLERAHAGATG
jgi:hypothetical protein